MFGNLSVFVYCMYFVAVESFCTAHCALAILLYRNLQYNYCPTAEYGLRSRVGRCTTELSPIPAIVHPVAGGLFQVRHMDTVYVE